MIGMKTVEVTVPKDGKTLTVRLHDDTQTLDEVVVVAYGQQKKVSVTGSISAVGNRELKQGPTSSVTNSLTGRIPGLVTRQTSGRPGEDAAALYIRGRATVNDASPLIMVDGIERDFHKSTRTK
jgi:outer membrane receptor for Fe3+-dicitrate